MERRDRWEFCFTESFTTLQGQNGQKRIARAMTKVREMERERAKNLANEISGRTVEEKVAALFVYPSTTDHVSIDGEKKAFNLHLTTTLSSRD
jgi:hypothetical protein